MRGLSWVLLLVTIVAWSATAQHAGEPLDINTATAVQLVFLPGMGQEYARRVIAGRPYTAKNQLATRGVIPLAEYQRIAAMIVAHRAKRDAAVGWWKGPLIWRRITGSDC